MQPQAPYVASTAEATSRLRGCPNCLSRSRLATRFSLRRIAESSDVRPPCRSSSREFGLLEIHSHTNSPRCGGGRPYSNILVWKEEDGSSEIASSQFVTNVNPYQGSSSTSGAGQSPIAAISLFVLEATLLLMFAAAMKPRRQQTSA